MLFNPLLSDDDDYILQIHLLELKLEFFFKSILLLVFLGLGNSDYYVFDIFVIFTF